jgi:hypothetical protein
VSDRPPLVARLGTTNPSQRGEPARGVWHLVALSAWPDGPSQGKVWVRFRCGAWTKNTAPVSPDLQAAHKRLQLTYGQPTCLRCKKGMSGFRLTPEQLSAILKRKAADQR